MLFAIIYIHVLSLKTVSAPGASASPAQSASSPPGWSTAEIKEQEEIGMYIHYYLEIMLK